MQAAEAQRASAAARDPADSEIKPVRRAANAAEITRLPRPSGAAGTHREVGTVANSAHDAAQRAADGDSSDPGEGAVVSSPRLAGLLHEAR